jgi:CRP-like cAMP-binding protein
MESITSADLLDNYPLGELQQASTFGALSEQSLLWLVREGRITRLAPGEVLFEPGERGDSFFIILDGSVAYYKIHEGHSAYIREYKKGEQIGFVSTVALHDRMGRAVAKTKLLVLEIDSQLFHRLHQTAPMDFGILMLNLAREMARTIRAIDNRIVEMAISSGSDAQTPDPGS